MFKILLKQIEKKYDYVELIKVFLTPDQFAVYTDSDFESEGNVSDAASDSWITINESGSKDRNEIKRELFHQLSKLTGQNPPWGILTGVRPVKLTGELYQKLGSREKVSQCLKNEYLVSDEKIKLLLETWEYQQQVLGPPPDAGVGLYIGIPFCPTRCLYCSFPSNQKGPEEIAKYLDALFTEIRYCGRRMRETGLWPESVYIGGGTPTTLSANQLDRLLTEVEANIDLSRTKEFTVEAGRPDTITEEKLRVLKEHRIARISINPQSMKKHTLELIGRSHDPEDIREAFHKAADTGISMINADVIAGLPEETPEDYGDTLETIIGLAPENITVHTLAVKRASRLIDQDPEYHYRQGMIVSEMLENGRRMLREAGYRPYYLYRQKHMAGSFENVGYCKGDTPCIYNIRIMEEQQTIIALGAGGISKVYFPDENRLERIPNVTNYEVYIDRITEMLERKEENLFKEVQSC